MSEKSPSVADIWNKHYSNQISFDKGMNAFAIGIRNQTLAEVLKIIQNSYSTAFVTIKDYSDYLIRKIKKIQSQGEEKKDEKTHINPSTVSIEGVASSDPNTQSQGSDGERSKAEIRTSSNRVINPDTNTQNLKGCGEKFWDSNNNVHICGDPFNNLCKECQGKVKADGN